MWLRGGRGGTAEGMWPDFTQPRNSTEGSFERKMASDSKKALRHSFFLLAQRNAVVQTTVVLVAIVGGSKLLFFFLPA